jgi:alanine racemase
MVVEPQSTSCIELSRSALRRNLGFLQRWIGSSVRLCAVIKGNAYGHGIEPFVEMAAGLGVRHFGVFDAFEAARVVACKPRDDIDVMIMGSIASDELAWAVHHGVEVYVFDLERLRGLIAAAREVDRPARVHIEVETGLNRTGFTDDELDEAARLILSAPQHVVVEGLCTHFAGAESIGNYLRIQRQIERFNAASEQLEHLGVHPARRHTACSAAALTYPETIHDMVRFGIVMYGYWPSPETRIHYLRLSGELSANPLRRLIRWKSRIMDLKKVSTGEFVGYGTTYIAARDTTIATVPVGYAHGYARALSNQGRVLVRGKRVPVIGIVNMNLMIINVSSARNVEPGDEVVLIGSQRSASIPVSSFAELSNQLNYELLTRLPHDIPRCVVR